MLCSADKVTETTLWELLAALQEGADTDGEVLAVVESLLEDDRIAMVDEEPARAA